MSVSWKADIGYGFMIDGETVRKNSSDDEFLDDMDSYMEERYPLLEITYSGSAYSKDGMIEWICIKDSLSSIGDDGWYELMDMDKIQDSINDEALAELYKFVQDTGVVIGSPGWFMRLRQG